MTPEHLLSEDGGGPMSIVTLPHGICEHVAMTLRDYFAAHVLAQVYASSVLAGSPTQESIAAEAYEIADAMLAERAK